MDELTRMEIQVLTAICTSILLRQSCMATDYEYSARESLVRKRLVGIDGSRIFPTSNAIEIIEGIVYNGLLELNGMEV